VIKPSFILFLINADEVIGLKPELKMGHKKGATPLRWDYPFNQTCRVF
jgi:hypothetical protein